MSFLVVRFQRWHMAYVIGGPTTEVGAMLEALHSEIKTVSKDHSGLDKRLENIEIEIHGNSRRLDTLQLSSKVTSDKVSRLEDAVSLLSKDLKETKNELKGEIQASGTRLTTVETNR